MNVLRSQMSPFSHGNIIVAIISCFLICVGNLSKQTENKDDRPGAYVSPTPTGRLSSLQHGDDDGGHRLDDHVKDPSSSAVQSVAGRETYRQTEEGAVTVKSAPGPYRGVDGRWVNMTQLLAFLRQQESRRQRNRDAQWAYICVVVVICAMMWLMWWLGGLQHCRWRSESPTPFSSVQPLINVQDVVRKQRQYLPMFNKPEWEEVTMCNRATDP